MRMKIHAGVCNVLGLTLAATFVSISSAGADPLRCTLMDYKPSPGLAATAENGTLIVTWDGTAGDELRLRFRNERGTPTIDDLAIRKKGGGWTTIAGHVTPEFRVVSGYRRLDQEAYPALKSSVGEVTQQVLDRYKWDAFWDAPLNIPGDEIGHGGATPPKDGIPGTNQPGLPRKPQEVNRATAAYHVASCDVKTNGQRLEISFPGVDLGVFAGRLQYTVYRGTNLIRQEVIAKTEQPSVAYKYDAGLRGLSIQPPSKLVWRDTSGQWQDYDFGGAVNQAPATVRAANRLLAAEGPGGSIATFPPPHNFFWTREISENLGYTWYRKDSPASFSFGVRQAEAEDDPAYAGRGAEDRRQNFALYSARPGTWQRMPVYFVVSAAPARAAMQAALAYTRNDHYEALAGYWVMTSHFHTSPVPRLLELGGLDNVLGDFEVARAAGVNIFGPVGGGGIAPRSVRIGPRQPTGGPRRVPSPEDRLKGQAMYYEVARLHSTKDFLVMPNEEIFQLSGAPEQFGGHNDLLISHPVYWINGRAADQPLVEDNPTYGRVYHVGSTADLMEMAHREDLLIYMPHPNTKGSAGYPAAIKDTARFRDPNYRGVGFRWGMGVDRSEQRLSDYRCMPLFDEMNNWVADLPTPPKFMYAITETYEQGPGDDFYANNPVTYVKPEGQPGIDNWKPIIDAMMKGNYFVTSGEVLIPSYAVHGTGSRRTITADVEWTFPLEFAEVVWGDGRRTGRQILQLPDLPAFGKHHFEIPFDATGKKWVRFAVWDTAGDGAFVQPIKLAGQVQATTAAR